MLQFLQPGVVTVAYIGATILFILALGGLSHPETARRGNLYGMIGMSIALLATVFGVVTTTNYGSLDRRDRDRRQRSACCLARRVQMTQMPELVAILHSLVGLAAVLVGFANSMDPEIHFHRRRVDDSRYRDLPRYIDRGRHFLGFGHRIRQAQRSYQR